jgi:hypothetical protein
MFCIFFKSKSNFRIRMNSSQVSQLRSELEKIQEKLNLISNPN